MASNFLQFFVNSLPDLLNGLGNTLLLTFVAITAGFFIGLSLALGRVYGTKTINWVCIGYIEVIRGTPLLVQLFIIYFGLPFRGHSLYTAASSVDWSCDQQRGVSG